MKGINRTSLQVNVTQYAYFNESNHESHTLKVACEIRVVNRMNFHDNPQLDLSYISSNSQDDWSCGSESTINSNLDNWGDNSGLIDDTFLSVLFSISRVQSLLDINSSHVKHNFPN